MGARTKLPILLSIAVFALGGCGNDGKPVMSLEEFAKRDCALSAESDQRLSELGRDFLNSVAHPSALADAASGIAQSFKDGAAKTQELGDPPNGEGKGGATAAADMMRSVAKQVEQIAAETRTAQTHDEIMVDLGKFNQTMSDTGPMLAELKAKYPTPELDKVEKDIPGCDVGS
jgi:hypothetical protein